MGTYLDGQRTERWPVWVELVDMEEMLQNKIMEAWMTLLGVEHAITLPIPSPPVSRLTLSAEPDILTTNK